MKKLLLISMLLMNLLLGGCSTISQPSSATGQVDFGAYPDTYKSIVKKYLAKKTYRSPLNLEKINYLSEPDKFVFKQLTQEKFGYRICIVVPTQNARELRSHFFLINNEKVTAHLHDSGLIGLSDQFCNIQLLALSKKVTETSSLDQQKNHQQQIKYLICQNAKDEMFFTFNAKERQLNALAEGQTLASYPITELTDSFIVAESKGHKISINRVSGRLVHRHNGNQLEADCELTDRQKF